MGEWVCEESIIDTGCNWLFAEFHNQLWFLKLVEHFLTKRRAALNSWINHTRTALSTLVYLFVCSMDRYAPFIITFFSVCPDGQYISKRTCAPCQGYCKGGAPCNKLTGRCDNGCQNHWKGDFCNCMYIIFWHKP